MNHEHQRDYFERRSELRQSIDRAIELKGGVSTSEGKSCEYFGRNFSFLSCRKLLESRTTAK